MPKLTWITNLRVLATLTVILLHIAGNGSLKVGKLPMDWWWLCHIINTFGRFAVPVFVMLSGYLLLGKYQELGSFLSKRMGRVFIPFLVWTLIYIIYGNFYGYGTERTGWQIDKIFIKILTGGGGASGHLWFVYMLLGLYAVTPIISRWIKTATEQEIWFLLMLWVVSSTGYPWVSKLLGFQIGFELRYFSGYVGYFVLGYYLGNKDWQISSKLTAFVFVLAWAVTAFIVYAVSMPKGVYDNSFSDYLSPSVMLMSVSIFLFFKNACNVEFLPNIMTKIDAASYGMYLCHWLIMRWLSRNYQINYTWHHPALGIAVHFLLCAGISYLIVFIFSKIPKGNWVTG
jgi:surface polysaccharide O-acyltransferase-like enzyme